MGQLQSSTYLFCNLLQTHHSPIPHPSCNTLQLPFPAHSSIKTTAMPLSCLCTLAEEDLINMHITWAKDECTSIAKANTKSKQCHTINIAHTASKTNAPRSVLQTNHNACFALSTTLCHAAQHFCANCHVHFDSLSSICYFNPFSNAPMITYDSGTDSHNLCKADCLADQLSILQPSTK